MKLYILRHAIAIPHGDPGYPNDDRPLTEEGIRKMEKAARGMVQIIPPLDVIFASPLKRAHHTARIVAAAFGTRSKVKVIKQLLPGTPGQDLADALGKVRESECVMIVGHEPDLSVLVASLLGARSPMIDLKKGGLCLVEVAAFPHMGSGRLLWHLTPKQLRLMARK